MVTSVCVHELQGLLCAVVTGAGGRGEEEREAPGGVNVGEAGRVGEQDAFGPS